MNNRLVDIGLFVAPLQGFTEAPWRHAHAAVYGHDSEPVEYFTPFIRVEKGVVRSRDIRDLTSSLNLNHRLTPQAIFRDVDELRLIADAVARSGFDRLDLNLGCPFPPQWRKGRGAGLLLRTDEMTRVADFVNSRPDIGFSVKMRLGIDDPCDYRAILPAVNRMNLRHLTVHPRIARQEYSGEPYWDEFARLLESTDHRVIVNGDIAAADRILEISRLFPRISGVMVGRGLLARPSLFRELTDGVTMDRDARLRRLHLLHTKVFDYYCDTLCGDSQILSKIKPFWLYLEAEIGRKSWKAIKKSTSLISYREAIASIP